MSARKKAGKRADAAPLESIQELLRSAGLRSTEPRIAVLRHLHASSEPNSHADLVGALGDQGFDRATIYRNLIDLANAGIVSRKDLGDHVWRFELRRGVAGTSHSDEHPHFVCIDCGEVSCLPGLSFELRGHATRAPRAVGKKKISVQLKGLCDDCA